MINLLRLHAMTGIRAVAVLMLFGLGLCLGCGDEEEKPATQQRGAPAPKKSAAVAQAAAPVELPPTRPDERPVVLLSREDFGHDARDPFRPYRAVQTTEIDPRGADEAKHRAVLLRNYDFDDLRLIAIVRSGRRVRPRALFVGADGISKSVEQGQYFSRNEVLLATVNSDYIEIEIVDEDLVGGLDMQRGERRAIYLKKD